MKVGTRWAGIKMYGPCVAADTSAQRRALECWALARGTRPCRSCAGSHVQHKTERGRESEAEFADCENRVVAALERNKNKKACEEPEEKEEQEQEKDDERITRRR